MGIHCCLLWNITGAGFINVLYTIWLLVYMCIDVCMSVAAFTEACIRFGGKFIVLSAINVLCCVYVFSAGRRENIFAAQLNRRKWKTICWAFKLDWKRGENFFNWPRSFLGAENGKGWRIQINGVVKNGSTSFSTFYAYILATCCRDFWKSCRLL